jgi:hypothetical protein
MRNYPKYTPKPKVRAKKESFCLKEGATSSILELVRQEGNRKVKRKIEFYNLDAIISVGFRVNTKKGIMFLQWTNKVLREEAICHHNAHRQRGHQHGLLFRKCDK